MHFNYFHIQTTHSLVKRRNEKQQQKQKQQQRLVLGVTHTRHCQEYGKKQKKN